MWESLGGLSGSRRAAAIDTGGLCGAPRQADVLETGDFGGDKLLNISPYHMSLCTDKSDVVEHICICLTHSGSSGLGKSPRS